LSNNHVELHVPEVTRREQIAIKAMAKGEADPDQQLLAMEVIVKKLAMTHDLPYVPGDSHGSSLMAGRQFVGYKILKFVTLPVENDDNEQFS